MGRPAKMGTIKRLTEAQADQINALRAEGATQMQIEAATGVPQRVVSSHLRRQTEEVAEPVDVSAPGAELEALDFTRGLALAALTPKKLAMASAQQCAMVYAILTDKKNLAEGKATVIIGHDNRGKVEDLATRLAQELKRRGITIDGEFSEVKQ